MSFDLISLLQSHNPFFAYQENTPPCTPPTSTGVFSGALQRGLPNGPGTITPENCMIAFLDIGAHQLHNEVCTLYYPTATHDKCDSVVEWHGLFVDGVLTHGRMVLSSGAIYEGDFLDLIPNGHGRVKYGSDNEFRPDQIFVLGTTHDYIWYGQQ
jgi:hypothetical protein